MTTLVIRDGPAKGAEFVLYEGDPVPEELQLSVPLPSPKGAIADLPEAVIRGTVTAVFRYRRHDEWRAPADVHWYYLEESE